jgi:hypothetical protein
MEVNRGLSPDGDVARLVSSPSNKSRPTSQSGDGNNGTILGLDPWFTGPKFTELVTKSNQHEVPSVMQESVKQESTIQDEVVTEKNVNKIHYRKPRVVAPKSKKVLPKISKVPSNAHTIHIIAPMASMSDITSLADSKSVSSKLSLINSTSKQSLTSVPGTITGTIEENKNEEFSIASKISNSLSSSMEASGINLQQSSLYSISAFQDVDLLPALSKTTPTKLRGNMLQSNLSYVKKYVANASFSQSVVNESELMTSSVSDLQSSSILSCSNKPNNDHEINANPIVHMVHNRVTGWMLTSTSRRQQLVGMLDNAHHTGGVPTEIYLNASTDSSAVSRVRERQVNSWHSQVSRTLQARESVPDCKSTVRSIQEKLLSTNKNPIREKGTLTTLLNKKLDRVDIIANAKQIQVEDLQPPAAGKQGEAK